MATFSQGIGKVCYLLPWLSPPQRDRPLSCEEGEDQLAPSAACPALSTAGLARDLFCTLPPAPAS